MTRKMKERSSVTWTVRDLTILKIVSIASRGSFRNDVVNRGKKADVFCFCFLEGGGGGGVNEKQLRATNVLCVFGERCVIR